MLRSPVRLSSPIWQNCAMVLDIVILWAVGIVLLPVAKIPASVANLPSTYLAVLVFVSISLLACSSWLYQSWRFSNFSTQILRISKWWFGTIILLLSLLFLFKFSDHVSRLWMLCFGSAALVTMVFRRIVIYSLLRWIRSKGFNYKGVLIVGSGEAACRLSEMVPRALWSGYRIVKMVEPDGVADFFNTESGKTIDEVWLCLPLGDRDGIFTVLSALKYSPVNIRLVPDWFSLKLLNHGISEVVGVPMLDLSASPISGKTWLLKEIEDRLLGLLILVLISPVMLIIAIAIKLTSPGPILFKQKRHGWNGEEITVYKFRSMKVHQENHGQVTQATRNDNRITPLGAFLRKTSLDELPQFLNVLQGRMSIVGPRPHAIAHNEYYKEVVGRYMLRHKVKPGITGWAQINGFRGETDTLEKMEKRVEYDLYYIEHLSVWLDLKIIVATLFKGFVNVNAY